MHGEEVSDMPRLTRQTTYDMQDYLTDVDFPATKYDLIENVEEQGAGDEVVELFSRLPDEMVFESPEEVTAALVYNF